MGTEYTLEVNFDVQQISQRLKWNFYKGKKPVLPYTGANTGQMVFDCGDTVTLMVTGNSHNSLLKKLAFTQCHLVTYPIINSMHAHLGPPGDYSPPSPFTNTGAVIDLLGTQEPALATGDANAWVWQSPAPQTCVNTGRWEMSLILTADITLNSTDPYTRRRVFSFDPECEVGTGIGASLP